MSGGPCGYCGGLGLTGKRDEWGLGIPCFYCDGTGVRPDGARQLREYVARLEEYLPPSPERDAALAHAREQIRRYDEGVLPVAPSGGGGE